MMNRREFVGAALALGDRPLPSGALGDRPLPSGAKPLTLMSYNIRMGCGHDDPFALPKGSLGHLPQCAEVIRGFSPDVVGIQEIDRLSDRAGGVDQAAELGRLCGLKATYVPKVRQKGGDYGLAVLSRSAPLSVTRILMPGSCHTRLLMVLEFERWLIANTHFPLSADLCENAAHIVTAVLKGKIQERVKPVFLMGDFNSRPSSNAVKILRENFALLSDGTTPTWPARSDTKHTPQCIDYVFVDRAHEDRFTVVSREVRPVPEATDHAALIVRLEERS